MIDFIEIWQSLDRAYRVKFIWLIGLSLITSISELLSIGALIPFLKALVSPGETAITLPIISRSLAIFKNYYFSNETLIYLMGAIFGLLVFGTSIIRWHLSTECAKFSYGAGGLISRNIFKKVMLQPYIFHLNFQSSEIIDVINNQVQTIVSSALMASLQLLTSFIMIFVIAAGLLWLNPDLTLVCIAGFSILYCIIYLVARKFLLENSRQLVKLGVTRIQLLQESIGGIRDIQINGTYNYFVKSFEIIDNLYREAQRKNTAIGASPKYFIEGFGAVLIIAIAIYFAAVKNSSIQSIVPELGVIVMAAQRTLPMLQQIFSGLTSIRGVTDTLRSVKEWSTLNIPIDDLSSKPIIFNNKIELQNVSFKYLDRSKETLRGINLVIPKNQCIGLSGLTGAGKSTLVDIISGLLEPTEGILLIDDIPVQKSISRSQNPSDISNQEKEYQYSVSAASWRKLIAYVPQNLFLADASIERNIAFGIESKFIDPNRIAAAIKNAHLDEVIHDLPNGLQTIVGEGGIRLSGGQRQRIGIARALYKQSSVLILDESTSALDNVTEENIIQSLLENRLGLTIIIISHRAATLRYCDTVYKITNQNLLKLDKVMP